MTLRIFCKRRGLEDALIHRLCCVCVLSSWSVGCSEIGPRSIFLSTGTTACEGILRERWVTVGELDIPRVCLYIYFWLVFVEIISEDVRKKIRTQGIAERERYLSAWAITSISTHGAGCYLYCHPRNWQWRRQRVDRAAISDLILCSTDTHNPTVPTMESHSQRESKCMRNEQEKPTRNVVLGMRYLGRYEKLQWWYNSFSISVSRESFSQATRAATPWALAAV